MHSFINHVQRISRWDQDPNPKMLLFIINCLESREKENENSSKKEWNEKKNGTENYFFFQKHPKTDTLECPSKKYMLYYALYLIYCQTF